MHEPTYRQALKASWRLAWNHKILWIFGLFAAFWGQMGLMDLLSKLTLSSSYLGFSPVWWMTPRIWFNTSLYNQLGFNNSTWIWLIWLGVLLLGMLALLIFMSISSQGTIIKSASKMVKSDDLPDLEKAWQAGTKHFWRLLFLNVFKKIILVCLGFFLGALAVLLTFVNSGLNILFFIILFIILAGVGMIISFLAVYAAAYVVVENYKLFEAIGAAWKFFTKHWLVSIEVGLIVLVLNVALTIVAVAGLFLVFFPSLLFWLGAVILSSQLLVLIGTLVGFILLTLFIFLLVAIFSVFNISIWTYLFAKMHHEGIKSRILHYYNK